MKRRKMFRHLLIIGLSCLLPISAYAVSSQELIESAKAYDGKIVHFSGELIGQVLKRGEFAWLNLNDGLFAIGIFSPASQIPGITHYGGYRAVGDKLMVKGVFHRACPEHGGDLDIHAISLEIVKPGHQVEHSINPGKIRLALGLAVIALIVVTLNFVKARARK